MSMHFVSGKNCSQHISSVVINYIKEMQIYKKKDLMFILLMELSRGIVIQLALKYECIDI